MLTSILRSKTKNKTHRNVTTLGFTIVELAIVITVIAILAAITVASYTAVRDRATATAVRESLQKTEQGFRLQMSSHGIITWPRDTTLSGANNPNIADVAQQGEALKGYLPSDLSGIGGATSWVYDNDGDNTTPETVCADATTNDWSGVLLAVGKLSSSVINELDSQIDGGDGLACGRLRKANVAGDTIIYQLSWTQDV